MTEMSTDTLTPNMMLHGEKAYEAAIDLVIGRAQRELLIFDQNLAKGGYSSLKRYEALRAFLARSSLNRLVMVLHDEQYLQTHCPRLMGLLKVYSHAITIHVTDEQVKSVREVFLLADQVHYLHRFHADEARFTYVLDDPAGANPLNMKFAELLESCSQSVSATTSGL